MPQAQDWAAAFREGVAAIGALGGAKPGDRTMLDALAPAADARFRWTGWASAFSPSSWRR